MHHQRSRSFLLSILVALFALAAFPACASSPPGGWTEETLQRRERIVELASKAAAARLVADGVADPQELARAADVLEATVLLDFPKALAAAGFPEPEWELFALLVQERLEPYRLEPFVARFVSAAARGVRAGALGVTPAEDQELEELESSEGVSLRRREVPADEERARSGPELAAAGAHDSSLDAPVAGAIELAGDAAVFEAA